MKEVTILQIDGKSENAHYKMFSSLSMLETLNLKLDKNDYKVVFNGTMDVDDAEDVYRRLQGTKPNGYKGHSLSVSDIVYMDGKYMFCDSFGFVDVSDKF
jgi:hypothetical protein